MEFALAYVAEISAGFALENAVELSVGFALENAVEISAVSALEGAAEISAELAFFSRENAEFKKQRVLDHLSRGLRASVPFDNIRKMF